MQNINQYKQFVESNSIGNSTMSGQSNMKSPTTECISESTKPRENSVGFQHLSEVVLLEQDSLVPPKPKAVSFNTRLQHAASDKRHSKNKANKKH